MNIYVNGKATETELVEVHYADVVALAGMSGNPSVTYRARLGHDDTSRAGTLYEGKAPIRLIEGMAFNVVHTGNA